MTSLIVAAASLLFANNVPADSSADAQAPHRETELYLPTPPPMRTADFESSDELLNAVWDLGAAHLNSTRDAGFRDTLYSAARTDIGSDTLLARAYLWYAGDTCPLEAELYNGFLSGATPDLARVFLWPESLLRYLDAGGDTPKARLWAAATLPRMLDRLETSAIRSGLLPSKSLGSDQTDVDAAALNAFYYRFLTEAATAVHRLDLPDAGYAQKAERLLAAYRRTYWDETCQCVLVPSDSFDGGILANALAVLYEIVSPNEDDAILDFIRSEGAKVEPPYQAYVIEACLKAGEYRLGHDMLTFLNDPRAAVASLYLVPEYLAGINPRGDTLDLAPRFGRHTEFARLMVPVPAGRVSVHHDRDYGVRILVPPDTRTIVSASLGVPITVKNVVSHGPAELTPEQRAKLDEKGWSERVGSEPALWVSIGEQRTRLIADGKILYEARSASAEKGIGSEMNSLMTPLGWHSVVRKVGDNAPWGQVFRARAATREIWQPGEDVTEDLVLSRILLLDGEEPGLNKGGSVDSFARNIYIHGTNDEARLGVPSSHGCIRLSNDDVIELYDLVPKDTKVLITEF